MVDAAESIGGQWYFYHLIITIFGDVIARREICEIKGEMCEVVAIRRRGFDVPISRVTVYSPSSNQLLDLMWNHVSPTNRDCRAPHNTSEQILEAFPIAPPVSSSPSVAPPVTPSPAKKKSVPGCKDLMKRREAWGDHYVRPNGEGCGTKLELTVREGGTLKRP